jgi:hypothetical protein
MEGETVHFFLHMSSKAVLANHRAKNFTGLCRLGVRIELRSVRDHVIAREEL